MSQNSSSTLIRYARVVFCALAISLPGSNAAFSQVFDSRSDGSDGPLNLTTPGTIIFDPRAFQPPLDPDGDNVFHFTTITVGTGVTLKLTGQSLNGSVFFLAQGAVQINGTIDLNGEAGADLPSVFVPANRKPSIPGAGGYAGGVGSSPTDPPQGGFGPGGGAVAAPNSPGNGGVGSFTGNRFLVPLVGGSGGAGGRGGTGELGAGAGAGGGAVLIASSTTISVAGPPGATITANGGGGGLGGLNNNSCAQPVRYGGGGSGGAIRLVATALSGFGGLSARGLADRCGQAAGSDGRIRLEAFQQSFAGNLNNTPVSFATPSNLFLPSSPSSIRVTSLGGEPVLAHPSGSFDVPDVVIDTSSAVAVAIEARNIPLGTVAKVHFYSENGPDIIVDSTPLAGSPTLSTATASVTLPTGYSRGLVRASWTQ